MKFKINNRVKYLNNHLCEVERIYQTLLMNMGLTDSEYVVMFTLLELGEGCLQKDISKNSYINKKTINSTVKNMELRGLLRLKPGKYPNMHIYLTEAGKEYLQERVVPMVELENEVMSTCSDAEFEQLINGLDRYIKSFYNKLNI